MGGFNLGGALNGGMEGFISGLPQGAEFVRALRTAAAQQQELGERKRQFDIESGMRQAQQDRESGQQGFQNTMQLNAAGAQPVNGQGQYSTTLNPTPSLGMEPFPATMVASPGDSLVTPPGGSQQYRLPTADERNDADLAQKVNEAKAVEGAKQFNLTLPGPLGDILGVPHGSTVTVQHAPTAEDYARMGDAINEKQNADTKTNAPAKPEKTEPTIDLTPAEKKQFGISKDQIPQSEYKARSENYERVNGRPKAAGDQPKKATPGEIQKVLHDYAGSLRSSDQQMRRDLATADTRAQKAQKTNQGLKPGDDGYDGYDHPQAIRDAYLNHSQRMVDAQKTKETGLSQLYGYDVGHDGWADKEYDATLKANTPGASNPAGQPGGQQTGAPNARGSAQPTGGATASPQQGGRGGAQATSSPAGGGKVAKTADIEQYMKAKGVTKDKAIRAAQAAGYKYVPD